jgi:hypothetical protein
MNNPDHISESLEETIFVVKRIKIFDADPVSVMEKIRTRERNNSDPGSGINIPDPATLVRSLGLKLNGSEIYSRSVPRRLYFPALQ